MRYVDIWTDGACKGNPGPGGYGVVIIRPILDGRKIELAYGEQCGDTTNNREEMKTILYAFDLAATCYKNDICIIHSDSAYCVNMCNNWIYTWAKNNWKNSKKKEVENLDLVFSFYNYLTIDFFNCQVVKTNGHCGIIENELADALATGNDYKFNKIIKDNHILYKKQSKTEIF